MEKEIEKLLTYVSSEYDTLIMNSNMDVNCDLLKMSLETYPLPIVYTLKK